MNERTIESFVLDRVGFRTLTQKAESCLVTSPASASSPSSGEDVNNFDKTLDLVQQLVDPKTPEFGIPWEHVCRRAVNFLLSTGQNGAALIGERESNW